MVFNFQVIGLLVIFTIICFYYVKDIKASKESIVYRGILLVTYILQLLYISVYISMRLDSNVLLFSKLYLGGSCIVYSLVMAYFLCLGFKKIYTSKQSLYNKKVNQLGIILLVINVVNFFVIFFVPLKWDYYLISGWGVAIAHLIQITYTLISGYILLKFHKKIDTKTFNYILSVYFVMILTIILEFIFWNMPITNSGIVIITLIIYLTLENYQSKEIVRLQVERDYAVKNNAKRKNFFTNMSQEVRVPLNTIDGFSQIIMESDDIDSIKEDANDIRVASKNLIDIINGLIDISIIESGKLEIINENYNVYDMFDNIVNIINSRLNDSDVKFIVNIDKDIPKVLFGDAERIEQILLNILMNAIKHTTKGQIRLDITSIKTSNKCRLKIKISDTGVGIKKENIEKLFDNSNYINSNSSGYGLGLIISKQLLDLMEGEIDVSSIYGEGSTFIVTIDQKIATDNNLVINTKERKVKPVSLMGKRILVVDDNKLNIKVATKLLSPYKVEIKDAYSGQECLDILDKDNDFDLILMDDMMPHMSGTETLDILKKIERIEGYSIPVVVLTANAVTGMKNKYLASGFDDYLAKPIDRGELDRVLRKFLKDKKG
jgi:signal transduction histidine kinase/ActR/RegA family two-component response regulator